MPAISFEGHNNLLHFLQNSAYIFKIPSVVLVLFVGVKIGKGCRASFGGH